MDDSAGDVTALPRRGQQRVRCASVLLVALVSACVSDPAAPVSSEDPAEEPSNTSAAPVGATAIDEEVRRVTATLDSLSSHEVKYDEPPFGGRVQAWSEDGRVVRAVNTIYNEHGTYFEEFFFRERLCFFALRHSEIIAMMEGAPANVTETRYYFEAGRLIKQTERTGTFPEGATVDMDGVPFVEIELTGDPSSRIDHRMLASAQRALDYLNETTAPADN